MSAKMELIYFLSVKRDASSFFVVAFRYIFISVNDGLIATVSCIYI